MLLVRVVAESVVDQAGGSQLFAIVLGATAKSIRMTDGQSPVKRRGSPGLHASAQRQGGCRERLGPLTPESPRFARGLDRGLLDVGDGALQLIGVLGADGDQAGGAEDTVTCGEGFLVEDVVVLGALLGILDLANPLALGCVGVDSVFFFRMSLAAWSVRIGVKSPETATGPAVARSRLRSP